MNNKWKLLGLIAVGLASFALGRGFPRSIPTVQSTESSGLEAVSIALSSGGHNARITGLIDALGSMEAPELEKASELFATNITMLGECEIRPFADRWAEIDGVRALQYFKDLQYPAKREVGMKAVMRRVALENPDLAEHLLEQLRQEKPRLAEPVVSDLVAGLAHADPERLSASLAASRWPLEVSIPTAIGALLKSRGLSFTLEWSTSLIKNSSPELQSIVFRKTIRRIGRIYPEEIAPWVLDNAGGEYSAEGPRILVEMWQEVDPESAYEWLLTMAPEETRDRALEFSFARWARERPEQASPWLEAQGEGEQFDPARLSLARLRVNVSPKGALKLCEEIRREDWRDKCWTGVARHWVQKDHSAAVTWMNQSSLTSEQREGILKWAERRKKNQSVKR